VAFNVFYLLCGVVFAYYPQEKLYYTVFDKVDFGKFIVVFSMQFFSTPKTHDLPVLKYLFINFLHFPAAQTQLYL